MLEIFAGGGGVAVAIREHGGNALACVERDRDACATLRACGFPVIEADVRDVDFEPYAGRVELLWASPPCQAFSQAGNRQGANDERNGWPWTLDVVDQVRPDWVICENVPGMTQHSRKHCGDPGLCPGCYWLEHVVPAFEARYPCVEWLTLDAADFGTPQHRRRVFLFAGHEPIRPVIRTHGDPAQGLGLFRKLEPWNTIGAALGFPKVTGGGRNPTPDPNDRRRYRDLTHEPSTTISAVKVGNAGPFIGDPEDRVSLTWQQAAILQDFDPDHPFHGSRVSIRRQIGNAVPRRLARAVLRCLP